MMAANELNAHAFLQVSKLIPGKAFYMYSLVPFGNCKLRYLNKNYMEKILLSFAPKKKKMVEIGSIDHCEIALAGWPQNRPVKKHVCSM